jgi:hypothetical protein
MTLGNRFDQHELVRQYTARHLREDMQYEASTRDHHSAYYLTRWHESEDKLKSAKRQEILRELIIEIDNFRTAWDWAVYQKQFGRLGACLRALLIVYDLRGWLRKDRASERNHPRSETARTKSACGC